MSPLHRTAFGASADNTAFFLPAEIPVGPSFFAASSLRSKAYLVCLDVQRSSTSVHEKIIIDQNTMAAQDAQTKFTQTLSRLSMSGNDEKPSAGSLGKNTRRSTGGSARRPSIKFE